MQEKILQFLWQYSLYRSDEMMSTDGQCITVLSPGTINTNEGPDFIGAKIRIGNIELIGNVEIHINESDWLKHGHSDHKEYQNIILHIVYNKDLNQPLGNFPTLDIKPYIAQDIIDTYSQLMHSRNNILCQSQLNLVPGLVISSWLERLLIERWQAKQQDWEATFADCHNDYQELLYRRLAHNFGFKINSDTMMEIAITIPFNIITKLSENILHLEALFYGQADLLPDDMDDAYIVELKKEYQYLAQKYSLNPIKSNLKFLRLRPGNFPTIRISQFVQLLSKSQYIFQIIINKENEIKLLKKLLSCSTSEYWNTHYTFAKSTKYKIKSLGESSIENIIINTIAPFLYFYGNKMGDESYTERAFTLLIQVRPEHNYIIEEWAKTPIKPQDAFQTQALIHLYNHYCTKKRCLECAIGLKLMKNK